MNLDVSTLTFAGGLMSFASGLFLLMHWWQASEDRAALSWGMASCARGVAVTLFSLQDTVPDFLSTILAPMLLTGCNAEFWAAARIFRRGSIARRPMIVGLGMLIAAATAAGASGHVLLAVMLNLGGSAAMHAATAVEFWLARAERPAARVVMILLLTAETIALGLAAVSLSLPREFSPVLALNWFGVLHFVGLIFSGGSALSLITMLKDRGEARHRAAALVDPLTGLANRRAMMTFVERAFEKSGANGAPISVIAFDLDNFKKINDTFGHPTGDRVLRIFGDVLSSAAGANALAGRMGGEEFAVALSDCHIDDALAVAGRARTAFQDAARFIDGQSINATVSAGVATAPDHGTGVADILASADKALYRAKSLGRNRVILSVDKPSGAPASAVTRIA